MRKIMNTEKIKRCCICGREFVGFGNNPAPVRKQGLCCNDCNYELVIPARINDLYKDKEK